MSISSTDVVVREACGPHFPGGFTNNLRRCAVGVTEYSVKHIAITDASDTHQTAKRLTSKFRIPDNGHNIITRKGFGVLLNEALRYHNPRYLVCCECTIIGLCLPVRVAL